MAYRCLECGNRASKKFPGGRCPACDSYNIKSSVGVVSHEREKPKKTLFEIIVMSLLWGLFLWGIWDRYFSAS